jgi:hypothetical protein
MAQPQRIISKQEIERQLTANRANLQALNEQADVLDVAITEGEKQVIAAKAALEGWDLGYRFAKAEVIQESMQKAAEPPAPSEPGDAVGA